MARLGPAQPLPLPKGTPKTFFSADAYVDSLLELCTNSQLLQNLCGGVHILDFFTQTPDLYESLLPLEWRKFLEVHEIEDVLDLFLREDVCKMRSGEEKYVREADDRNLWRNKPLPPSSLIEYILAVRSHSLDRSFNPLPSYPAATRPPQKTSDKDSKSKPPSKHALQAGMNVKKQHEVSHFARHVADLADRVSTAKGEKGITHIVDFGSGQNYLGRSLASEPYRKHIIAVESRPHVVKGAKKMDLRANLGEKEIVRRDKKKFKELGGWKALNQSIEREVPLATANNDVPRTVLDDSLRSTETVRAKLETPGSEEGSVQYVEHRIQDGDLSAVIEQIVVRGDTTEPSNLGEQSDQELRSAISPLSNPLTTQASHSIPSPPPAIMVISLHSCGNLIHHGLRTIALNPSVQLVAMIGCCYNLMTERLGPRTFKIPNLRQDHTRLTRESSTWDQHGFPMSRRYLDHRYPILRSLDYTLSEDEEIHFDRPSQQKENPQDENDKDIETGVRLNITARMMAVQAPHNWSPIESSAFFTRHFYRAVLQRIFLDKGVITAASKHISATNVNSGGDMTRIQTTGTAPIIIGALAKKHYVNFVSYVRGAVHKLLGPQNQSAPKIISLIKEHISTMTDAEIAEYETRFLPRKKHLSTVWSLMAFSSQVVEAMIVVDRWLWLREQDCVGEAWVETVFDYGVSPRNLAVVGVRK